MNPHRKFFRWRFLPHNVRTRPHQTPQSQRSRAAEPETQSTNQWQIPTQRLRPHPWLHTTLTKSPHLGLKSDNLTWTRRDLVHQLRSWWFGAADLSPFTQWHSPAYLRMCVLQGMRTTADLNSPSWCPADSPALWGWSCNSQKKHPYTHKHKHTHVNTQNLIKSDWTISGWLYWSAVERNTNADLLFPRMTNSTS